MLRILLLVILFFLIIRLVKYAFFNRPSVSGPRRTRNTSGNYRQNKSFDQIEDADFEILDEDDEKTRKRNS